ncbi:MAG: hypothetical protein HY808_04490 [Nitrospirae bacterium]|nr:hypothetical protein [Nitrospirota bacterium]
MRKFLVAGFFLTGILFLNTVEAMQTKVIVRIKSKDAKFVGTSMGGALITIRDVETGKVLAEGLTSGGTGDTNKIMNEPVRRFARLTDDATAKFETTVDIAEPALVTIEAEAPMSRKPDTVKSSTQVWLIPGKDMPGDGIVVEVPGFSVTAVVPEEIKLSGNKAAVTVQATIVMI